MLKKNKKGFILVETLIVTIFVMTLFMYVYQNVIPNMGKYEKMSHYDDIDSIYASNLIKHLITRYANTAYIDEYLKDNSYIIMNNCEDNNLYINSSYCSIVQKNLNVSADDYIFITTYDISEFKKEVLKSDFFDSGKLSNFRDYIYTVPKVETFYSNKKDENIIGKYRLFITRTITEADYSTTTRYANIGIYTGEYQKYIMGEKVEFDPGTGTKTFYVLKNSPSTESTVTLILGENLANSNIMFNDTNTASRPNTVLKVLYEGTKDWTNVTPYTTEKYVSVDGYTIPYNGYRARLLTEKDLLSVLGCKNDSTCFDYTEAFEVEFDQEKLSWLIANLGDNGGYWTASTIPETKTYAWTIKKGKVSPTLYTDTTIGVRPVITISKEKLNG